MLPSYMPNQIYLCPSILSADFACLAEEIHQVEMDADWIHVDVMDGHYVPNLTFGAPVLSCLKPHTNLPLDCHLMVEDPERYIDSFARAGADGFTVHLEACRHLHRCIQEIHQAGMSAGVSLNPASSLMLLEDILEDVDLVLLMSVNPGFGGQTFIEHTLKKIQKLAQMRKEFDLKFHIEVDGGIHPGTIQAVAQAGANAFVSGSAVFHASDPCNVLQQMRFICREEFQNK